MVTGRATAELVAGSAVTALMTVGYIVYVSRTIGAVESSDFFAALSVIYVVGLAFGAVTPTVARLTTRYGTAPGAAAGLRAGVLRRVLVVTIPATAASMALSPVLGRAFHFRSRATLVLAFAAALVYVALSVDRGVLQGLFQLRTYNFNVVAEAAVRLAAAGVLMSVAKTAAAALLAYVIALAVSELLVVVALSATWRGEPRQPVVWSDVEKLAVPMVIFMCGLAVFQNTDTLAIKRWLSAGDAGAYGAATTLARGIGVIFAPFYVVVGPLLTSLHDAGRSVFPPAIRLMSWFLAAVLAPLAILAATSPLLISMIFGRDFLRAAAVAAPLAGVTTLTFAGIMLAQALVTLHDFRFLAAYAVLAAAQVAGLSFFHASYREVLSVMYVAQGAAFVSILTSFLLARKARH